MIRTKEENSIFTLTLDRPEKKNALNLSMLKGINEALDRAEKSRAKIIFMESSDEVFCSGMDLDEAAKRSREENEKWGTEFAQILKRLTTLPFLVVSHLQGRVFAGGVGLLSACDVVLASEKAQLKLTEAYWGLVPAIIAPYLIRRAGWYNIYKMALLCQTVSAQEAKMINLVDIMTENPQQELEKILIQIEKIDSLSIRNTKEYFQKLSLLTDQTQQMTLNEFASFLNRKEKY